MTVRKFRSIEEMNEYDRQRSRVDDPRLFERIASHWKACEPLTPPLGIPEGVHKFRTIDEMSAFKESYIAARIAHIREARGSSR